MYTGDDNCDAMRGEAFDLVVDEAAKLSEMAWTDAIVPTLADHSGKAVLISTPRGRNWFWRWWMQGQDVTQERVRSFTAPSSANPLPSIRRVTTGKGLHNTSKSLHWGLPKAWGLARHAHVGTTTKTLQFVAHTGKTLQFVIS